MSASADWQQEKTLAECNNHMLQNKISCDVSFLVGHDREETELVEAHKYVLISRSPVFFTMFCGELAETEDSVRIPDIDPDIFRDILQYIYCDTIVKDAEKLEAFFYGAEKYMLSGMIQKCMSWISSSISQDTVCSALNCATLYRQPELKAKCLDYLFNNAQEVIQGGQFTRLSSESLKCLLASDDLDVDEATIFEACLRWAEAQCNLIGVEDVTDQAIRDTLGQCLYSIRFTQMAGSRFVKLTKGSNVLSPEEKLALQEYFITQEEPEDLPFNVNPRGKLPEVNRFSGKVSDQGEWNCHNGKVDAIAFSVSKAILLKGACLYGGKHPTKHQVHLELIDESGVCVRTKNEELESNGRPVPVPVRFTKSVYIQPRLQYTLKVSMQGDPVYRGVDGRETIEYLGLTISFFNSRLSKNGTEKTCGQIPGIVFKMLHAGFSNVDELDNSMDT